MKTLINTDWEIVNTNIEISKITRFNYKKILGESLTSYVTKLKLYGCSSKEAKEFILTLPSVINFLDQNPKERDKFINNLNISVSSRFAEQNTYTNIIKK